eukprot:scaffold228817_cov20-Prasinocladus_malaysianus.AAC.1
MSYSYCRLVGVARGDVLDIRRVHLGVYSTFDLRMSFLACAPVPETPFTYMAQVTKTCTDSR